VAVHGTRGPGFLPARPGDAIEQTAPGIGECMVSVVICTYNRSDSLRVTLGSLARMYVPLDLAWELLVVDNNSSDDTRAVVEEFARSSGLDVRYVFEGKQGKSNALNTGVREARGEKLAFTDDDVIVDAQWLASIAGALDQVGAMGVGGKCVPVWEGLARPPWIQTQGPYQIFLKFDFGDEPLRIRVPPWGMNMAFHKSAFQKYGLFRTDLGPVGSKYMLGEDTEFANRLIKAGEKIVYTPGGVVGYPVDPGRLTKSWLLPNYFRRGRAAVHAEGRPEEAVCYFGVPRYELGGLFRNLVKWISSVESPKRFYFKLKVWRCAGAIYEAFSLARQQGETRR